MKDITPTTMEAYLMHGRAGAPHAPHTPMSNERVAVGITEAPRNPSKSGYGVRVPTQYVVMHENRWRRVYAYVVSNSPSYFIGASISEGIVVSFYD